MKTRKVKAPSPMSFVDAQDYFKAFFEINKANNPTFSHRTFAAKIKWPASYLSDLTVGRKHLSVARALQFAGHFKMTNLSQERLLWFALAKSKNADERAFFERKIRHLPNQLLNDSLNHLDHTLANDMILVLKILHWKKTKMSAEEIIKLFEMPLMTIERIQRALDKLEADHNVVWNEDGSLQKTPLPAFYNGFDHSDTKNSAPYEGIELHREFAANFLAFIEKPQSPSTYHSALIAIPRGQFMPVAMKIIELRNWILEYSRQYLEEAENSETGSYLMQLDMNLFPIKKRS